MKITLGQAISTVLGAVWLTVCKAVSTMARRKGVYFMQKTLDGLAWGIIGLGLIICVACFGTAHLIKSDGFGGKK